MPVCTLHRSGMQVLAAASPSTAQTLRKMSALPGHCATQLHIMRAARGSSSIAGSLLPHTKLLMARCFST